MCVYVCRQSDDDGGDNEGPVSQHFLENQLNKRKTGTRISDMCSDISANPIWQGTNVMYGPLVINVGNKFITITWTQFANFTTFIILFQHIYTNVWDWEYKIKIIWIKNKSARIILMFGTDDFISNYKKTLEIHTRTEALKLFLDILEQLWSCHLVV